jgi:solute carrier family 25 protein 34/35
VLTRTPPCLLLLSVLSLEQVKSRQQFAGESGRSGPQEYRGVLSSLRAIYAAEGPRGLYRGIAPAYALQVATTGARFGTFGLSKGVVSELEARHGTLSAGERRALSFAQAALAGAVGGFFGTPFFGLKTRAQVFSSAPALAVGTQHRPKRLAAAFADIYLEGGLRAYARGMQAFMPRVIVYSTAQLGVNDVIKPVLRDHVRMPPGLALDFSSAFIAAVAAVVAIQPFDFVAARLLNQPVDPRTGRGQLYDGFASCLARSVQAEGLGCLAKGMWPNMVRMGPYTVLVLVLYERLKALISST